MLSITALPFCAKHLQVLLIYPGEFLFFNVVDLKEMTNNDDNEVTDEMKRKDPSFVRRLKNIGKEVANGYINGKLYQYSYYGKK